MKGCSVFLVSIAILFSLVIVTKGADFTGITCDFPISDLADFISFVNDPDGLGGDWIGNKNVCFQEGLYDISNSGIAATMYSQQTWYGPQYLADPTCGGSFSPSCARTVSASTFDYTKEAVMLFSPTSEFTNNAFSSYATFAMIGLVFFNSNSDYDVFYMVGGTTLINNYFYTPDGGNGGTATTFDLLASSVITNNWFDGSGQFGSTTLSVSNVGLISNNYFSSQTGLIIETESDSQIVTVTGNVFLGKPGSIGVYISIGSSLVQNNTFIAPYNGIRIASAVSGTNVIDGNLFVFSYSDISNTDNYVIYIGNTNARQTNITNNVFVGPQSIGISNHNPHYLANNDFSQSGLNLVDSTWDVSAAHVSNNYFGPDGPYNTITTNSVVDNVVVPNTYVTTASSSVIPFTTTPNHPSLIAPPLVTIDWYVAGSDRPYFIVGDQTNFTWTYSVPTWYSAYGIPSSYFTTVTSGSLRIYAGAESYVTPASATMNLGVNFHPYTITSSTIQAAGTQNGYFGAVTFMGITYATSAKSIFLQSPANISLETLPVGGHVSGSLTADIFTDSTLKNISIGFSSAHSNTFHTVVSLSNGTGSTQSYTLPVKSLTSGSDWAVSVSFTLPSGDTYVLADNHTFGYAVQADCNITVYLNKRYNTTAHPNIKKYCPSTPYSKIAWSDSELSDNKGTVSLNQNSTYFIVTPYQNRSGIATWNYGVRLPHGVISNFTATLIVTSANPSHDSWTNVTWNLESNQSINVTQNIGGLVSYSPFPVQITGLYAAPNAADTANTQQVDAMSLYLKKQKAVLVGQSDGTLTLYKANVNGNTVTAGAVIKNNFSSHWTFLVSLWAGDEDLEKTNDTASITLYVN